MTSPEESALATEEEDPAQTLEEDASHAEPDQGLLRLSTSDLSTSEESFAPNQLDSGDVSQLSSSSDEVFSSMIRSGSSIAFTIASAGDGLAPICEEVRSLSLLPFERLFTNADTVNNTNRLQHLKSRHRLRPLQPHLHL